MIVDFPVAMTDFVNAPFGEFFVYFGDGDAELAMKIFDAVSPDKKAAVLSFTAPVHASMTPPTVIEATGFLNRSVGVVRDVVIRPPFEMNTLRTGSPSVDRPGPIIFGIDATYIRAYARNGCVDVDLGTGATEQSRAHPGSIWVEDWQIILVGKSEEEVVLCERGKPAAT